MAPTRYSATRPRPALHGFDRCLPDVVELTVSRDRRGVHTPFTVHTTKYLSRLDLVTVDGWRCTSATRTVIDLARLRIPTVRLEAAIDSAVPRVDFCFEAHDVIVEVSGQRGHSSPGERARDAQRRNELQDLGRRVYECTFEDVTRRPQWVVSTLHARLIGQGQRIG